MAALVLLCFVSISNASMVILDTHNTLSTSAIVFAIEIIFIHVVSMLQFGTGTMHRLVALCALQPCQWLCRFHRAIEAEAVPTYCLIIAGRFTFGT